MLPAGMHMFVAVLQVDPWSQSLFCVQSTQLPAPLQTWLFGQSLSVWHPA
jgi:hypothetical protein